MSIVTATSTTLDTLHRRISHPRRVGYDTLIRREKSVYRLCRKRETALELVDNDTQYDGWKQIFTVLQRAYAIHAIACKRANDEYERRLVERHESEELAAALQAERINELLYGGNDYDC